MMTMRPPCEVVVKDVLPAIRAMLVKELIERHQLSQVEVARKLGITQPAVSQYLSELRGSGYARLFKRREITRPMRELSNAIARGEVRHSRVIQMYCNICKKMKMKEILCVLHAKSAPYLKEEGCRICLG